MPCPFGKADSDATACNVDNEYGEHVWLACKRVPRVNEGPVQCKMYGCLRVLDSLSGFVTHALAKHKHVYNHMAFPIGALVFPFRV